jgi:hypothetical protein
MRPGPAPAEAALSDYSINSWKISDFPITDKVVSCTALLELLEQASLAVLIQLKHVLRQGASVPLVCDRPVRARLAQTERVSR